MAREYISPDYHKGYDIDPEWAKRAMQRYQEALAEAQLLTYMARPRKPQPTDSNVVDGSIVSEYELEAGSES